MAGGVPERATTCTSRDVGYSMGQIKVYADRDGGGAGNYAISFKDREGRERIISSDSVRQQKYKAGVGSATLAITSGIAGLPITSTIGHKILPKNRVLREFSRGVNKGLGLASKVGLGAVTVGTGYGAYRMNKKRKTLHELDKLVQDRIKRATKGEKMQTKTASTGTSVFTKLASRRNRKGRRANSDHGSAARAGASAAFGSLLLGPAGAAIGGGLGAQRGSGASSAVGGALGSMLGISGSLAVRNPALALVSGPVGAYLGAKHMHGSSRRR